MANKIIRAVIIGAPGSGKGTISKRIVKSFGFRHIAAGDILRLNIAEKTDLGCKAKSFIETGQLVPDNLVIKCIMDRIAEIGNKSSLLLDGFPRTVTQAKTLQSIEPIDTVISLNIPHDIIIERVKGRWIHLPSGRIYNIGFNEPKVPFKDDETGENLIQRPDDQPDIVRKRLELFEDTIQPVMKFYNEMGIICEFSGRETNQIWPKIEKFLSDKIDKVAVSQSL